MLAPRREGVEYDVEPAADRFLIVHNTDTPDADLAWAPFDATSHEQWVPWLRLGGGRAVRRPSTRSTTPPCSACARAA